MKQVGVPVTHDAARIRLATPDDVRAIELMVERAYSRYLTRMDRPPRPLTDDYSGRVEQSQAFVLEERGSLIGALVLVDEADHLLLNNVAVDPDRQGNGLGRKLIEFADAEARSRGYREIRLYTNVAMPENLAIYPKLGFVETGRGVDDGYHVVFMTKVLP